MKRIISVIALVLAMTMVMSVSAFAAKSFSVADGAVIPEGVTVTPAADSIAVSVPATNGADYSVLLVSGNTLPTTDSVIAYINQDKPVAVEGEEDAYEVAFNVLPLMSVADNAADGALTLYIGTNATGENLISIPVTYAEPAPAGFNVAFMNGATIVATLTSSNGAVVAPEGPATVPTPAADALIDRYEFVGWTDANGTTTYATGDSIAVAADTTLYAKYKMYSKADTTKVLLHGDIKIDGNLRNNDKSQVIYYFASDARCTVGDIYGKLIDSANMTMKFGDINGDGNIRNNDKSQVIYSFANDPRCTVELGVPIYFINK